MRIGPVKETKSDALKKAVEFIKKNEWTMHLTAYRDIKQRSICHWVKSFKWEVTTVEDCEKRLIERIKYDWEKTEWLEDNLRIALTSFFYNVWFKSNILNYAHKWDISSVKYLMNKYIYCWWKICWGLKIRRANEIAMITNLTN